MGLFSFLSGQEGRRTAATAADEPPLPRPDGTPAAAPSRATRADAADRISNTERADRADRRRRPATTPQVGPLDPAKTAELQGPIIEVIKTVFDPEIPVDIYELGLIYEIIVDAERRVLVKMTLTSPACPSAQQIPSEVRYKVKAVPGVTDAGSKSSGNRRGQGADVRSRETAARILLIRPMSD